MIEQIKAGDKLTVIKVNSLAATSINEITIDSIQEGKAIFAAKRKRYYLSIDNSVLVLKGHNLGITQGSWNNGATCFLMSGNCNLGGLDRESMIALLKPTSIQSLTSGIKSTGLMEQAIKAILYSFHALYLRTIFAIKNKQKQTMPKPPEKSILAISYIAIRKVQNLTT